MPLDSLLPSDIILAAVVQGEGIFLSNIRISNRGDSSCGSPTLVCPLLNVMTKILETCEEDEAYPPQEKKALKHIKQ